MWVYYTKKSLKILIRKGPLALMSSGIGFAKNRCKWANRSLKIKKNYFHTNLQYDAVADPLKIITVDPNRITKYLDERPWGRRWEVWGGVVDGEWDFKKTIPIEEYPHYRAFNEHFRNGTPWEETCIIDYYMSAAKESKKLPYKGCETWGELREHYIENMERYDKLHHEIREQGFQATPSRGIGSNVPNTLIGRGGDLIFRGEGHHRLAIAKAMALDEIPVHVYARHKQWQELRDDIYSKGLYEELDEGLRNHPDLQDVIDH